jgi:hypothetical protein
MEDVQTDRDVLPRPDQASADEAQRAAPDSVDAQRRSQALSDEAELGHRELVDEITRLRAVIDQQQQDAAEIRAAQAARYVIEQAKGIIMGSKRCSAEDAFAALLIESQQTNTKLRAIARRIVDGATQGE